MLHDLYGRNFDKNKRACKSVFLLLSPLLSSSLNLSLYLSDFITISNMVLIKLSLLMIFVNLQKIILPFSSLPLRCKD
jgi:hypothetical protein